MGSYAAGASQVQAKLRTVRVVAANSHKVASNNLEKQSQLKAAVSPPRRLRGYELYLVDIRVVRLGC